MSGFIDFLLGRDENARSESVVGKRNSKAATWVRNVEMYAGPRPELPGIAAVSDDGVFSNRMLSGDRLKPEKAIELARWILDTFGEPEEVKPNG